MGFYWITFKDKKGVCAVAKDMDEAAAFGRVHAGEPCMSIKTLPYPAGQPIGRKTNFPSFCYRPHECAGKHSCQAPRACND
jgi:hypothetical protein